MEHDPERPFARGGVEAGEDLGVAPQLGEISPGEVEQADIGQADAADPVSFSWVSVTLRPMLPTGPQWSSNTSMRAPGSVSATQRVPMPCWGSNRVLLRLLSRWGRTARRVRVGRMEAVEDTLQLNAKAARSSLLNSACGRGSISSYFPRHALRVGTTVSIAPSFKRSNGARRQLAPSGEEVTHHPPLVMTLECLSLNRVSNSAPVHAPPRASFISRTAASPAARRIKCRRCRQLGRLDFMSFDVPVYPGMRMGFGVVDQRKEILDSRLLRLRRNLAQDVSDGRFALGVGPVCDNRENQHSRTVVEIDTRQTEVSPVERRKGLPEAIKVRGLNGSIWRRFGRLLLIQAARA